MKQWLIRMAGGLGLAGAAVLAMSAGASASNGNIHNGNNSDGRGNGGYQQDSGRVNWGESRKSDCDGRVVYLRRSNDCYDVKKRSNDCDNRKNDWNSQVVYD